MDATHQPPERSRLRSQLEQGHLAFGALIAYWRGRSKLSGNQLVALSNWSVGERNWLDPAVVSRIENGRQARGASLRNLLAFDAINAAIHLWQTRGKQAAWDRFGLHSGWGVRDEWVDGALWLPVPDQPQHPLEFSDFAEVLVGRLELPYLSTASLGDGDAQQLSSRLSDLLNAATAALGLSPRDAVQALLAAYPSKDQGRQGRLVAVALGTDRLSRDELEAELYALAETIRTLRQLEPGSYGPGHLAQELSAGLPASA